MPLPIVDLSPFLTSSSPRSLKLAAAAALNDACCTHGFFYLSHHNIPSTLQSSILETAHTFFRDTADVQKNKLQRLNPGKGGDGARGYQRLGENVTQGKSDFHEALDFYRPVDPLIPYSADPSTGWRLLHGPNIWPQEPVQFQPLFEEYFSRLRQLGDAVIVAMAWALGYQDDDEEELLRSTRDGFWVARVIGYPPLGNNESSGGNQDGGVSCGVHTGGSFYYLVNTCICRLSLMRQRIPDYGCTTFLLADDTPGALQVLSKSGVWINADPIEGLHPPSS
jgi:isopenicillin N synthase-like dioxygenase